MPLPRALPFHPSVRPLHAATYLFAVPLFSISFLVFLNSSLSFVLTTLFAVPPQRLGSVVGTLGFVDELVVIVAAPLWGLLSDTATLGTRGVAVLGYLIVALSLVVFVNIPTVYPGLVFGRILFSLGAAAVATMVSAILPEMTMPPPGAPGESESERVRVRTGRGAGSPEEEEAEKAPTGKLAGLVGLFTGCGALLALGVFLPLPARFAENPHGSPAAAVRHAFYVVGAVAFVISIWCAFGLAPPRNSGGRGRAWHGLKTWVWTRVWGGDSRALAEERDGEAGEGEGAGKRVTAGPTALWLALKAGFEDGRIGVGYVGGFVARASSVGVSLFIPLFVNHYFVSSGRCQPTIPELTKDECRRAYILASELTGISQMAALLLAPGFGFLTDRCSRTRTLTNAPLILSALLGILGFTLFSVLPTPEAPVAFFYSMLMGASQIGAIVASLGILSRGIVDTPGSPSAVTRSAAGVESEAEYQNGDGGRDASEHTPLVGRKTDAPTTAGRENIKGSIAGVYSLFGGVAILLLTKAGGAMFDAVAPGAPFWVLAGANGALLLVAGANSVYAWVWARGRGAYEPA